jgi:phenylpyruvate tautomerase PptA (4-oxalocrotonate tautomerase family)
MPNVEIRLPHGRYDADARQRLAKGLTSSLLAAEGLPENDTTRALTWVSVEESSPGGWTIAAEPAEDRAEVHAFARITTFASLLDDERRAALLRTVNDAVVELAGGDPLGGLGVWTVIEEVPDGRWGVAGNPIDKATLDAVDRG